MKESKTQNLALASAIALAEKISARKTAAEFFADRAQHGTLKRALEILPEAGSDIPKEESVRESLKS